MSHTTRKLTKAFAAFLAVPDEPTQAELDAIDAKIAQFIDAEADRLRRQRLRERIAAQARPFGDGAAAQVVAGE